MWVNERINEDALTKEIIERTDTPTTLSELILKLTNLLLSKSNDVLVKELELEKIKSSFNKAKAAIGGNISDLNIDRHSTDIHELFIYIERYIQLKDSIEYADDIFKDILREKLNIAEYAAEVTTNECGGSPGSIKVSQGEGVDSLKIAEKEWRYWKYLYEDHINGY